MNEINPSEEIRKMLEKTPQPKPKEIQAELRARGIDVTANLIKVVRHKWRKKKERGKRDQEKAVRHGYPPRMKSDRKTTTPEPKNYDYDDDDDDDDIETPSMRIGRKALTPEEANKKTSELLRKAREKEAAAEDKAKEAGAEPAAIGDNENDELTDLQLMWLINPIDPNSNWEDLQSFVKRFMDDAKKKKRKLKNSSQWFEVAKKDLLHERGPFWLWLKGNTSNTRTNESKQAQIRRKLRNEFEESKRRMQIEMEIERYRPKRQKTRSPKNKKRSGS